MAEINQDLISDVKIYLDITWADDNTDKKVTGIIKRGIIFLDDKAGAELNYLEESRARELLMEYCRYTRDGILDKFMINYAPFLTDLRAGNGGAYDNETTNV